MTPDTLLELVQHLTTQTLELASVEKLVGGTFTHADAAAYIEHTAVDAPGFARVWLQEPRAGATFSPRLSLRVDASVCATWDQARARFGFGAKVPVHPGVAQPPDDWWQYPQVTATRLSLSFDRVTGCLTEVSVHPPTAAP
ncbi:MAG: hypothetical protein ABMB14_24655 [Myxococcota bacterium]